MIGVVVCTHNQHDLTSRTIESLAHNTVAISIVVVDDGSDPPFKCSKSARIEVIRHDSSLGVQRSRNQGLRHFQQYNLPPYLLFCDGDVVWKPGALDRMFERLDSEGPTIGYCYGDVERTGLLGGVFVAGDFSVSRLLRENYISTMSLIKSSCLRWLTQLGGRVWVEDEQRLQDWSLWLRLLRLGVRGVWIPEILFVAHYGSASISTRGDDDFELWRQTMLTRYVSTA